MKTSSIFQKMNRVLIRTLLFLLLTFIVFFVISSRAFTDFSRLFGQQQLYYSFGDILSDLQESLLSGFNGGEYSPETISRLCVQLADVSEDVAEAFPQAQFLDTRQLTARYLDKVQVTASRLSSGSRPEALESFEEVQSLYQELNLQYRTTIPFQIDIINRKADEIRSHLAVQIPGIILLLVLAGGFSLLDGRQMVQRIVRPLTVLTEQTEQIPLENTKAPASQIPETDTAQEILQLASSFCTMSDTIREQMEQLRETIHLSEKVHALEMQNVQMQMEVAQAQVEQLQSLVNPHFLFNCLGMLSSIAILENAPQTYDYSLNLAGFLRTSLKAVGKVVTLNQEISHLQHYIALQKRRFGERFSFILECGSQGGDAMLPSIIFQPLVENSLIHGIAEYPSGGTILIHAGLEHGRIHIFVKDNGVGITEVQIRALYSAYQSDDPLLRKKTGLYGVIYILRYYFGKDLEMQIEREEKGVCISFFFPYETSRRPTVSL